MFIRNSGPSIIRCLILLTITFSIHYFVYCLHITILPFKNATSPLDSALPKIVTDSLFEINNITQNELREKNIWASNSFDSIPVLRSVNWHKLMKNYPSMFSRVFSLFFLKSKLNGLFLNNSNSNFTSPWCTWSIRQAKFIKIYENGDRLIGCVCNVFSYVPVFAGVVVSLLISSFCCELVSERSGMLLGYLLSYLPFAVVHREFTVFHYMIPMFFGVFNLVLVVDFVCNEKVRDFVYLMLIHFAVVGYFLWSPLSYGKLVGDLNFLFLSKNWFSH